MVNGLTAFRSREWRVAVAILLAAGCCAMFVPVPNVSSPEKDRSESYPCMDRPCGCASAEQCWKQCCCFTNQQKLAWAEKAGVKVPDYVVAAATREKAQPTATVAPKCAHCAAASEAQKTSKAKVVDDGMVVMEVCGVVPDRQVSHEQVADANSCTSVANCDMEDATFDGASEEDRDQSAGNPRATYFCGISALECQGLTSLWQILSMTMLPEPLRPEVVGPNLLSNVPEFDLVVCSCDWPAPEPPPRIGVVGFRAA